MINFYIKDTTIDEDIDIWEFNKDGRCYNNTLIEW